MILLRWLAIFIVGAITSLSFQWPLYYQRSLIEQKKLVVLGHHFTSVWTFLVGFYFLFWPLWFLMTFVMFWLIGRAVWFDNRLWIIHLTIFVGGQFAAGFGIHYFNKGELPDVWVIMGILFFIFCMIMSAVTHA